jgi:hypothetical protein
MPETAEASTKGAAARRGWLLAHCGVRELTDLDWVADAECRFRHLEDIFYRWVQGLN